MFAKEARLGKRRPLELLILFPNQIEAIFGELSYSNPLFILAVYAPGIAGVLLVFRHYGFEGLLSFLQRLTLWRMSLAWWLVLLPTTIGTL